MASLLLAGRLTVFPYSDVYLPTVLLELRIEANRDASRQCEGARRRILPVSVAVA